MTAHPLRRRLLTVALIMVAAVLFAAGGGASWFRSRMIASLPPLEGTFTLAGLDGKVTVERDALGTPTVTGTTRLDVARATGWLHAQDRFFQMDLLRRRGGGELAGLFGAAAVPLDKEARLHGFRELAHAVLTRAPAERRALLEAYTQGVNAGLAALPAPPWEYAVLRVAPRPWQPEDSILVSYAMTLDLQEGTGRYIRNLSEIRDELGPASLAFFAPLATPQDAALDGSVGTEMPLPPASEVDLHRSAPAAAAPGSAPWPEEQTPGSNAFAVDGRFTADGGALVANDMHLHLGLPNTWYRMALHWPGHQAIGVTLPGAPFVVAGSTGRIAWGFTNSEAGTGDVLMVDPSISPDLYHGPGGKLLPYVHRTETIAVHGGKPVTLDVTLTVWGPVVAVDPQGKQLVYHWIEDDPAATNSGIGDLEEAADVRAAVAAAHEFGIPAQNFIVADSQGAIAWTIAGRLPNRLGYDGRLPVTWAYGDRRWDGFLPSAEIPTIVSPPDGRLWTANNRPVGGAGGAVLGDAGFAPTARARQIRDDLAALMAGGHKVAPRDLLGVQLDDRALFLERWHDLLLQALGPAAVAGKPARAALLEAARHWEGRADASAIGYRVVREFRLAVSHRVLDPIFTPCTDRDANFSWSRLHYEPALETLVTERPLRFLDPAFASWDDLLAAAADDVAAGYAEAGADPRTATWGQHNTARIEHPFARLLPRWAAGFLAMPRDPLPGDANMPRVQEPDFGASERFVVSPGREQAAFLHMPGGPTANPFSPYFGAGHEAWVRGDPTPFLPGPVQHQLVLAP